MAANPYESPVAPPDAPTPRAYPQIAKALRLARLPAMAVAFFVAMVVATPRRPD